MKITKREIIASITIIAIMLLIGVVISGNISESVMDKNEKYNKALKIKSNDLFQYGMDTNIGNAFVYGELKAVDTVSYPDIKGKYTYIKKVTEIYTMHTRRVPHTRRVGKTTSTYYTTETYWTWDRAGEEHKKCKEITFCGIKFSSSKINLPSSTYKDTVRGGYHVRYKYYVCKANYKGTLFTYLSNKTIKNNSKFYSNMNINKTIRYVETDVSTVIFWVVWIILTCLVIVGFYYLDNNWLNN